MANAKQYNVKKYSERRILLRIKFDMTMFRRINDSTVSFAQGDLDEWAIFVYVALRILYKDGSESKLIVTPRLLYSIVMNEVKGANSNIIRGIKQGIEQLNKHNIIEIMSNERGQFELKSKKIDRMEKYFHVNKEYIHKVAIQKNGIKLLAYYLYLTSTINVKTHVGFMGTKAIAEELKINVSTVCSRNKKLNKLEVIHFVQRSGHDKNGNFVNLTNVYFFPDDCDEAATFSNATIEEKIKEKNQSIKNENKEETRKLVKSYEKKIKEFKAEKRQERQKHKDYIENPFEESTIYKSSKEEEDEYEDFNFEDNIVVVNKRFDYETSPF